jgi:type IV pilus assembly protein PilO
MDFKDPQVQKAVIIGVLLVIVGYVYFFTSFIPFFYQPMKAHIGALSSDYEKMSAELEKARKTVDNLANLEAEFKKLHEKWLAAQSMLPQEKEVAELLRNVTRAGNQAGVDFLLFEPQKPVQKEFISENPVKVKVQGQYHELGIFLSKVANLDRIVNVSNIHVKSIGDAGKAKKDQAETYNTIEAELTLTAYTILEGGETEHEDSEARS